MARGVSLPDKIGAQLGSALTTTTPLDVANVAVAAAAAAGVAAAAAAAAAAAGSRSIVQ